MMVDYEEVQHIGRVIRGKNSRGNKNNNDHEITEITRIKKKK